MDGSRRRGVAQPGSASALGAEGRRFESCLPDHFLFRARAILSRNVLKDVAFEALSRLTSFQSISANFTSYLQFVGKIFGAKARLR